MSLRSTTTGLIPRILHPTARLQIITGAHFGHDHARLLHGSPLGSTSVTHMDAMQSIEESSKELTFVGRQETLSNPEQRDQERNVPPSVSLSDASVLPHLRAERRVLVHNPPVLLQDPRQLSPNIVKNGLLFPLFRQASRLLIS